MNKTKVKLLAVVCEGRRSIETLRQVLADHSSLSNLVSVRSCFLDGDNMNKFTIRPVVFVFASVLLLTSCGGSSDGRAFTLDDTNKNPRISQCRLDESRCRLR